MSAGAERLRRAAGVLRERAERTSPAPWRTLVEPDADGGVWARQGYGMAATGAGDGNAEWIALADPVFGLAVADWLEAEALWPTKQARGWRKTAKRDKALAVADAVLGDGEGR